MSIPCINAPCLPPPIGVGEYGNGTTVIGYKALDEQRRSRLIGRDNSAFGSRALFELNVGIHENSAFGANALARNNEGVNSAFGAYASENVEGSRNSSFGNWSLRYVMAGDDNCAFGHRSMAGDENSNRRPTSSSYGSFNTAFGSGTMQHRIDGDNNTAIGYKSMNSIRGRDVRYNTGVGTRTLINLKGNMSNEGFGNTAVGSDSCKRMTRGSYNVALGHNTANRVTNGRHNTFIGTNSDVGTDPLAHDARFRTAIGADSRVDQNDSIVLGRPPSSLVLDKVGIRTTTPQAALNVTPGNSTDTVILAQTSGNGGDAVLATTTSTVGNALHGVSTGPGAALYTQGGHVYTVNVYQSPAPITGSTTYNATNNDHIIIATNGTVPAPSTVVLPSPSTMQSGQIFIIRNASSQNVTIMTVGSAAVFIPYTVNTPQFNIILTAVADAAVTLVAYSDLYYQIAG